MNLESVFRKAEAAGFLDGGSRFLQQRIQGALGSSGAGPLLRGPGSGTPCIPFSSAFPSARGSARASSIWHSAITSRTQLIALGLLATPPTLMTGWADWADRDTVQRRVGLIHAEANAIGVVAMLASYLRRRHGTDGRAVATSTAGLLAIGIGGALGGHLTYAMGAGVDGVREGPRTDSPLTSVG